MRLALPILMFRTEATGFCGWRRAAAVCSRKSSCGWSCLHKGSPLEKQHITSIMFVKIYQERQADEHTSSEFLVSIKPGEKMVSEQLCINFKHLLYSFYFNLFHSDSDFHMHLIMLIDGSDMWFMVTHWLSLNSVFNKWFSNNLSSLCQDASRLLLGRGFHEYGYLCNSLEGRSCAPGFWQTFAIICCLIWRDVKICGIWQP